MSGNELVVSVVIVSFNTRALLRDCLNALKAETREISSEVFVVDNNSSDGSADMVAAEFPEAHLIRSSVNLGFAAANNRAFPRCTGKYVLLLNSDAFLHSGALLRAIDHMEQQPSVGLGGAKLVGRDGSWQPSARMFPSVLNEFLSLTGLSARFAKSRVFGRQDRTWADQLTPCAVDWVPGAFAIIRRDVLEQIGYFDEAFFLYYEEVDLCRRIKQAGYKVWYWPDIEVVHLGGESSKTMQTLSMSKSGAQLTLWRMRSELIYYRKHLGSSAWMVKTLERVWHLVRARKNAQAGDPARTLKAQDSQKTVALMEQAWNETQGGRFSPQRPW
ncbi:MAG TPA: glycosyltransferase family 2 protein [Candidatus Angelobacter sp.]|nr:glycosyltransferase family 2 protein [Candidatus Angelobacter sp.]